MVFYSSATNGEGVVLLLLHPSHCRQSLESSIGHCSHVYGAWASGISSGDQRFCLSSYVVEEYNKGFLALTASCVFPLFLTFYPQLENCYRDFWVCTEFNFFSSKRLQERSFLLLEGLGLSSLLTLPSLRINSFVRRMRNGGPKHPYSFSCSKTVSQAGWHEREVCKERRTRRWGCEDNFWNLAAVSHPAEACSET